MLDSVRTRLTVWYVGVLALVLIAFSMGVYALHARNLHRRLDMGLRSALQSMAVLFVLEREEGETEKEAAISVVSELSYPKMAMAVFDVEGRLLAEKPGDFHTPLPQLNEMAGDAIGLLTLPLGKAGHDHAWRVAAQRVKVVPTEPPYLIVVSQSLENITEELRLLRQVFYLAVPLALGLAGISGWLLARKSLAPVAAMSEHARRISAENLDERLPVVNSRDELGRLAAAFNELLARLSAAFDQQRQFMADASHELRTPLYVIRTATDVTLEQLHRNEAEYRDALAMINQQSRRMTRIVENMFTLARADAGRRELDRADFYLDELLTEAVRAAQVLAERKNVKIELEPAPETPYRGDESLVRQMLLNLLDNAIKYTPPEGLIRVSLAQLDSTLEITVSDTGVGIPPEAQTRIFDRFYRVDKARSHSENGDGGGAGLGLSIARWIAEAHHGRLELKSSGAAGSSFAVSLPDAKT